MRGSWWRKASLIFLLLLVLAGGLTWIVSSDTGLRWAVQRANAWVPGLHIEAVKGSLRNFIVSGVSYTQPGVSVSLQQAALSTNVRCLLHSRLCVKQLSGTGIDIKVTTAELPGTEQESAQSTQTVSELALPYPLQLDRLAIDNLTLAIDNTTIGLHHFRSGMQWQKRTLSLSATELQQLRVEVVAGATDKPVAPAADVPLEKRLSALFAQPFLADKGDLVLPLDIRIPDFVVQQLSVKMPGAEPLQIAEVRLNGSTLQSQINLNAFSVRSLQGDLDLQGSADLSNNWPLNIRLAASLKQAPWAEETLSLALTGATKQQVQLKMQLSGQAPAELQAQLHTGTAGLPFSLSGHSKRLQWPLSGTSEYTLTDSQIKINGKATDYHLTIRSHLIGQQIPAAQISLEGQGNLTHFMFAPLRVATLQGEGKLSGQVNWGDGVNWQGQLLLSGINGQKQWPQWSFTLHGEVETRGNWRGEQWQVSVPKMALQGRIAQGPLQLNGALTGSSQGDWKIDDVRLQLGKNRLLADGVIDKQLKLDLQLEAPQLQGTLPGLAGSIQGKGKLRGQLSEPQLDMQLVADKLRWQELQINKGRIEALLQSKQQIEGDVKLELQGVTQASLQLDKVLLTLKGNERQHQLTFNMTGKPVAAGLQLQGHFDRQKQRWQGVLSQTRFTTPVGEWSLQDKVSLDYLQAQQQMLIGRHCWLNPNVEICLPVTAKVGAQWEAKLQLKRMDLALIKPWLPPATTLQGRVTGEATASWQSSQGLPTLKVNLQGESVKVAQQIQNGAVLPVAFDTLTLEAGVSPRQAQLDWLVKIAGNSQLNGRLRISQPEGRRGVSGEVNIDSLNLSALQPLLQPDDSIQGFVRSDLRLGGTLHKPALTGMLKLEQLLLNGRFMPFSMEPSTLNVQFDGYRSQLEGQLRTTQGQLNISGNSGWSNPAAWHAQVAAKGDKLRIVVPPIIRLDASPDLLFEAAPDNLQLSGTIAIPWARFTVQSLPEQAVAVSDDQVMLNDYLQPIEKKSLPVVFNSRLKLSLGNDVRLDAFGLKSKLRGDLQVNQDQKGLGLNGQVVLEGGRFHAYGQDLLIRRGNLLFSGAAQRPVLDIEAIRNPQATQDDVVAGVRISGLADRPQVDIFSEPAMSQQEALSYLVRGQGLNAESDQSEMMTSMLIGLGVAKSGNLVGKIGETFGISNLSLDTEGVGDKSQVVVSGYVLPGLQVKYGVGLFDSLATLTLRYRLMPKLYLEALSGVDLALDLLYQFEF